MTTPFTTSKAGCAQFELSAPSPKPDYVTFDTAGAPVIDIKIQADAVSYGEALKALGSTTFTVVGTNTAASDEKSRSFVITWQHQCTLSTFNDVTIIPEGSEALVAEVLGISDSFTFAKLVDTVSSQVTVVENACG